MTPTDDPPNGVILFRVEVLEESVKDVRSDIKEMRAEMKGGFAGLQFVSREVYASEKQTASDYAAETRRIAEDARRVAWATALFLITVTGLLLTLIKFVAK